ncbi:DICT sensory domain-containing protein [Halalkalirubrum salinum]|uniref:DICT sensory domain-containing protein n=1 Tax=Halalkalirubrum salinum TaxID=2563889 RepID=UPI001F10A063|nr:DICT sensory domain-containing protein [Halalkalirubrum salinum]
MTAYRSGEPSAIEQWLATHGVAIESRSILPDGLDPFIEIKADGKVVGIIGIEALNALIEPPIDRPGERDEISEGYRVLFEILEKTLFTGMSRRDLLAVSREIEDRAFRVGEGCLQATFQTPSIFKSQTAVYRTLATETDLDIHVYAVEDWDPPSIRGITYHTDAVERFESYWALAYNGGTDETQACGLVAKQRSDAYTGFWTNDPALVEEIRTALSTV